MINTKVFSLGEIRRLLSSVKWCVKIFDDGKYWVTDYRGMREILSEWIINKRRYVEDRYDCDDFSRSFKCFCVESYGVNSVGLVRDWLVRHAYILFPTYDRGVYVLEPQTSMHWLYSDRPKRQYLCKFALITF